MKRLNGKQWCWMFLPLALAAGCAHEPAQTQADYGPLPAPALAPTSDRGEAVVDPAIGPTTSSYAPPPGARADDWALAEVIRIELTTNKNLTHSPMSAGVDNGIVTLRGFAANERARDHLHEGIAALPGVKGINDQIVIQNTLGPWRGVNRDY